MRATKYNDEVISDDRKVMLDKLAILGMFKGEITEDYLKEHGYIKFNMKDIAVTEYSHNKFVVGFECLYSYEYFQSALDVLKAFDFDEEDIDIYIPKKEYPMIITVNDNYKDKKGEKAYLVIAQRVVDMNRIDEEIPKFLLKEER